MKAVMKCLFVGAMNDLLKAKNKTMQLFINKNRLSEPVCRRRKAFNYEYVQI